MTLLLSRQDVERILADVAGRTKVSGAGFTGLTFERSNIEPLKGFAAAHDDMASQAKAKASKAPAGGTPPPAAPATP